MRRARLRRVALCAATDIGRDAQARDVAIGDVPAPVATPLAAADDAQSRAVLQVEVFRSSSARVSTLTLAIDASSASVSVCSSRWIVRASRRIVGCSIATSPGSSVRHPR